jgi:hypothetical protein
MVGFDCAPRLMLMLQYNNTEMTLFDEVHASGDKLRFGGIKRSWLADGAPAH